MHNDIFRYQDDIFVDEQPSSIEPASGDAPIEVDSFQEEQIIVDSNTAATTATIPEPEIVEPTPDPIQEPIQPEPLVQETAPGKMETLSVIELFVDKRLFWLYFKSGQFLHILVHSS